MAVRPSHENVLSPSTRPSLSQSTDTDSVNQGPQPNLLPKFAISAESEGEETSGLGDPSKTSFSIGELPQDEHDATTPGSTHSGATLSGKKFLNCIAGKYIICLYKAMVLKSRQSTRQQHYPYSKIYFNV